MFNSFFLGFLGIFWCWGKDFWWIRRLKMRDFFSIFREVVFVE